MILFALVLAPIALEPCWRWIPRDMREHLLSESARLIGSTYYWGPMAGRRMWEARYEDD